VIRGWRMLVAAMIVWGAHFGTIWTTSSVFGSGPTARWIVLGLTAAALVATSAIAYHLLRRRSDDPLEGWLRSLGLLGCALAGVSILWQGLPAIII
jgi:hypothetical protein